MADIIETNTKKLMAPTTGATQPSLLTGGQPAQATNTIPFRDDIQRDKDRETKENIQGIKTLGDAMKNAAKQPFQPLAGSDQQPPPAFQAFQDVLRQQNPAYKQLQSAVTARATEDLTAPPAGLGEQSRAIATSDLARAMEAARIQQKGEAIKTFGPGTGQVGNVMRDFDTQSILQTQDLAGRLAVEDANLKEQQKAQAMSTALAAMGAGTEAEKLQLGALQAGEQSSQARAALALERYGIDAKIQAEQLMQSSDQQFKTQLQQQGYMNDKDIEQYRAGVEMQLTQMGFDQQTAMQVAQFQQEKLIQANEQQFMTDLDAVDKAWRTGERVDAQTFEKTLQNLNNKHDETLFNLNKNLQLDLQGNKQAFEDSQMKASMAHDYALNELGYTQEQALQHSQQVFSERMTQLGFTNDQALQAADAVNKMSMLQTEISSKEDMLAVEMAMQDSQFRASLGIKEADLALRRESLDKDVAIQTRKLDLDEKQVEAALKSEKVQNDMNMVAVAMELMPNNPAALEPFTDRLFQTLATEMGIPEDQIQTALSGGVTGGSGEYKETGDISTDAPGKLNSYLSAGKTDDARKYLTSLTSGGWEPIIDDINIMDDLKDKGILLERDFKSGSISDTADAAKLGLVFSKATTSEPGQGGQRVNKVDKLIGEKPSIVVVDGIPYLLEEYKSETTKKSAFSKTKKSIVITGKNLLTGEPGQKIYG